MFFYSQANNVFYWFFQLMTSALKTSLRFLKLEVGMPPWVARMRTTSLTYRSSNTTMERWGWSCMRYFSEESPESIWGTVSLTNSVCRPCRWKQRHRGTLLSTSVPSSVVGERGRSSGCTWRFELWFSSATLPTCSWSWERGSASTLTRAARVLPTTSSEGCPPAALYQAVGSPSRWSPTSLG